MTKAIKVLGPGCKRCETTAEMVRSTAESLNIAVSIEKITDYAEIAQWGVASTPGVVVDGKLVHAGGLPKADDIARWLAD